MFRLCLGLSAAVAIRWLRCSGCALGKTPTPKSLLLCQGAGQRTPGGPQVAASDAQAAVLMQAWSCDADVLAAAASGHTQCTKACVYYDDALQLHGVLWAPLGGEGKWEWSPTVTARSPSGGSAFASRAEAGGTLRQQVVMAAHVDKVHPAKGSVCGEGNWGKGSTFPAPGAKHDDAYGGTKGGS